MNGYKKTYDYVTIMYSAVLAIDNRLQHNLRFFSFYYSINITINKMNNSGNKQISKI